MREFEESVTFYSLEGIQSVTLKEDENGNCFLQIFDHNGDCEEVAINRIEAEKVEERF